MKKCKREEGLEGEAEGGREGGNREEEFYEEVEQKELLFTSSSEGGSREGRKGANIGRGGSMKRRWEREYGRLENEKQWKGELEGGGERALTPFM